MISDRWELETDDSDPSDKKTLAAWGITNAGSDGQSMAVETLSLDFSLASISDGSGLWSWETPLTLTRDDVVFFRGWTDRPAIRETGTEQVLSYPVRNIWWLLERTDYLQPWETSTGPKSSPRVHLGRGEDGSTRITTREILQQIATAATDEGLDVSFDTSLLPDLFTPPIEAHNSTLAELIRTVMRWHPDTTVVPLYSTGDTVLKFIPRRSAEVVETVADGSSLSKYAIQDRQDLVASSVHVYYEASVPEVVVESQDEGADQVRQQRRLLLETDVFPVNATRDRNSLNVIVPVSYTEQLFEPVPAETTGTEQPITAETLPRSGATGTAVENFWIDRMKLASYDLTTDDLTIAGSSTEDYTRHEIAIDEATVTGPPSAINPNATPLYRALTLDDLPRYLYDGYIHDWMGVFHTRVKCRATLLIRKTWVDGLETEVKAEFTRRNPREVTIAGFEAYAFDVETAVAGTDALTKVYSDPGSYNPGGYSQEEIDDINSAARAEAVEKVRLEDLAKRLYEARSQVHFEGSITLTEEDAGASRYLGKVLNIFHPDVPEWETMRAQIQGVGIDLAGGTTEITFGPPEHLAPQDWIELHAAARKAQDQRAQSGSGPGLPSSLIF